MSATPKTLLDVLNSITASAAPQIESLHARQVNRVREVFEDPNIVGVGVSNKISGTKETDSLCVCFYVAKKLSLAKVPARHVVPPVIATEEGRSAYTDVKEIGKIVPQAEPLVRRKPIESGFSVGHIKVTAGTLGAIVKKNGKRYLLSNAHVLANYGKGKPGDKIVYPAPDDGGESPENWVAVLSEMAPLIKGGDFVNEVDVALAELREERLNELSFKLPGVKTPLKTIAPKRGMTVKKRGRTTGTTRARIIDVDFRVSLRYPGLGELGFTRQVLCERYSDGGDSGSLVIDTASGRIAGLHFAGAKGGSVFNPIGAVMKALGFRFTTG